MIVFLALVFGCDDETTAFRQDLSGEFDLAIFVSQCSDAPSHNVMCNAPSTDWCQPAAAGDLICACAYPAHQYFCCDPSTWVCPSSPRTGDFCCPQPSGMRMCGSCTCVQNQFICNTDAGVKG